MKQLPKETVDSVRSDHAAGVRQIEIARKHNISPASVCRIVNGKRHAQPSTPPVQEVAA